jgi:Zn-dependent protease with chaperone function
MVPARATIDFFEGQRAARRWTAALVGCFLLALVVVVAVVYAAALVAVMSSAGGSAWNPRLLVGVAAAVLAVCGVGTGYHAVALSRGGEAVARMMGGTPVSRQTTDAGERRLLNVVEEMAIASGLPVPRAFVLRDEAAINAFAAGLSPGDAVLGVTRGCLEQLSRDELQGVVAHELSHVLNSDMRLNVHLLGAIGGLSAVSFVGRVLLRGAGPSGRDSSRGIAAGIALVGLLLVMAGWVGTVCGELVRFAISRERELLADAAAVQFTRNPTGLAGALRKIARAGSILATPRAAEASHLFFANAACGVLDRWLATHPPIEERLRRLEPRGPTAAAARAVAGAAGANAPARLVARVGAPAAAEVARAANLLAGMPPHLAAAAREPFGARAIACGLLLAPEPAAREAQLRQAALAPAELGEVRRLAPALDALERERRIALLDLALPSLDALSPAQVGALREDLRRLAGAHGRVTVFDWALQRAVVRRLERRAGQVSPTVRHKRVDDVAVECLEVLSLLAWVGGRDATAAQAALDAAVRELGVGGSWRLLPRDKLGAALVDRALAALDQAAPELKGRVLRACAAAALADARVTPDEACVLRAVSGSLGCPMPPMPLLDSGARAALRSG